MGHDVRQRTTTKKKKKKKKKKKGCASLNIPKTNASYFNYTCIVIAVN